MTDRRATNIAVGFAVLMAFYTGVRLPNAWSVTLQTTSLFDGFHRRFLVGSVLKPFTALFGYHYAFYATLSFLILAALLAVLVMAVVRTRDLAPRLWIIAWLLLPMGGFVFNEVGYYEQLLYLMLFGAIALVHRGRIVAATVLMSFTPMIHEIAILTVLPLFGLVLFRNVTFKRAAIATAIPAVINLIVLLIPASAPGSVEHLGATLAAAQLPYRSDALDLFNRTQHDTWAIYKVHPVVRYVRPAAELMLLLFGALWWTGRGSWLRASDKHRELLVWIVSTAAIAVPSLLVYGGWDGNRWLTLVLSNFFFVVYLTLVYRGSEPRPVSIVPLVIAVLIIARADIWYFDRLAPRPLEYKAVSQFIRGIPDGSSFPTGKE